jgi:hypothetical protein
VSPERLELSGDGLMRLAEVTAYNLYLATLVGSPAPRVRDLGERMRSPRPGDLVLETSTVYREGDHYESLIGCRLGRLLRRPRENVYTDAEWVEQGGKPDEPIPTEQVWYIELADGREYKWVNADFIAIPEEPNGFDSSRRSSDGRQP